MPVIKPRIGRILIGLLLLSPLPAPAADWVIPAYVKAPFPHRESLATFQFDASGRLLFPATTHGNHANFVHAIVPGISESPWTWSTARDRWNELSQLEPCAGGGFVAAGARQVSRDSLWDGDINTGWVTRVDASGKTLWRTEIGGWPASGFLYNPVRDLAVDAQCNVLVLTVFAQTASDELVSLRAADGSIAWTRGPEGEFFRRVDAVGDSWVGSAGEPDGLLLVAFDPSSGARRWQRHLPSPPEFAPASPAQWEVFALSTSRWAAVSSWNVQFARVSTVHAVSAQDGGILANRFYDSRNLAWHFDQAANGLAVALDSQVERIDANLQVVWSRAVADRVEALAGLPDGGVLVCTDGVDGEFLTRLGGSDGASIWPAPVQWSCGRVAVSPDGTVAAVSSTTSPTASPPALFNVNTSHLVAGQFETQVPLGTVSSTYPVLLDADTVIDTSVTAYRSGSALLVRAIARDSGVVRWTQRLEFGMDGVQRELGSGLSVALADGTILVSGYTSLLVPLDIPTNGTPSTRAVIARLRASDGAVLERTPTEESNAVTSFSVSSSGAVFASRYRVYRDVIFIYEVQSVDRMDGIATRWRRNDATRPLSSFPLLRVAATSSGVVAFDPRDAAALFQAFDSEDGSLRWVVTRTLAGIPNAVVSDGADRVFLVYPTRTAGPDTDITVERLDLLDGSAAWRHTFDPIPRNIDQLAGSVALLPSGIALAWNTLENHNLPGTSRTAAARISDSGVVEWTRVLESGPMGWRLEPRGMVAAPSGELLLLTSSSPGRGSAASIETAALAALTPDGEVRGMRTFAAAAENNAVTGLRAWRIWRSVGTDALLTLTQSAGPSTGATAMIPMDEFAGGAPSVSMTVTPIPAITRRARIVVDAEAPVVPVGTTGTLTVAMPPGLIAGPATCTTLGAVACGTVYGGTTVVLPLTFDAAGSVQLSFDAAMLAGPTLSGPIIAMIDIDHPFATTHIRDRVASATVNLIALPDPLFGNGFE